MAYCPNRSAFAVHPNWCIAELGSCLQQRHPVQFEVLILKPVSFSRLLAGALLKAVCFTEMSSCLLMGRPGDSFWLQQEQLGRAEAPAAGLQHTDLELASICCVREASSCWLPEQLEQAEGRRA